MLWPYKCRYSLCCFLFCRVFSRLTKCFRRFDQGRRDVLVFFLHCRGLGDGFQLSFLWCFYGVCGSCKSRVPPVVQPQGCRGCLFIGERRRHMMCASQSHRSMDFFMSFGSAAGRRRVESLFV